VQKKIGFLPNVFKVLAHAPAVLTSYVQTRRHWARRPERNEKEAIFLATSQVNGCDYCLAAHTLFAGKAGLSSQDILSARDGKLDAYALLAQQITESRGHLSASR
jgi:AhpD family alkylhydroperoxidase